MRESELRASLIIHKRLLLWSAATCYSLLPSRPLFSPHRLQPHLHSGDCSFNVLSSRLSGCGCTFTHFGIHCETDRPCVCACRPCSRPALPGKALWSCPECQKLQQTWPLVGAVERQWYNCVCKSHWTVSKAHAWIEIFKYWPMLWFGSASSHHRDQQQIWK